MANGIQVLVAEDNRDLCDAVCALIAGEPDMRVAGTAARVADLPAAVRAAMPRVLVLDLDLAGESSLPALQAVRAQQPQVAVVIHSGHDYATIAHLLAEVGHCEYVTKTGDVAQLLAAIRRGAGLANAGA